MNCAIKNENATHQSEGCSAGLDLQAVFPTTDDKTASIPLCPIIQRMRNLQFLWVKIHVTMHDAPYTAVRHA